MAKQAETRTLSGVLWLERFWQDIRYGCRVLSSNPGFALIAILSLAIGIGANCAIFSFADALLLRPLPVARPGELLTVGSTMTIEGPAGSSVDTSYLEYVDVRDRSKSFKGLAAYTEFQASFAANSKVLPKLTMGMLVSENFFQVMGIEPTLGRSFYASEHQVPGRDAVVVLGHTLWEQQFASDPLVLGRLVRVNGVEFTVVGVTPASFTGMDQFVRADFFTPLMMWPRLSGAQVPLLEKRDVRRLTAKGRLRDGVTLAQAQSELSVIAKDLERAYPDSNRNRGLVIRTELQTRVAEDTADAVLVAMLTTLALGVLLVACANVAGLLTSRSPARAREMAMRLAIGAGRARLIRQLITESLLIALAGGVLGLALGYAGVSLFRTVRLPTDLPIALTFQLDRRALTFSLAVAVMSAVIFGLVPALQSTRTDLAAVMKANDTVAPGRGRRWGRALLVCGQVAVSVVLLVVAVFIYRAFRAQLAGGPGYRTDHLVMMSFDPGLVHYDAAQSAQFFKELRERARGVPGVVSVTMASSVPMATNSIATATVAPEGFQFPPGRDTATLMAAKVDEEYFDTMGLSLLEGRNFRATDTVDAPRVAIVNEQFARHYWPGQDAVGKRFRSESASGPWVEVVGVAKMSKYIFIAEPPTEFVYLPSLQSPQPRMTLIARSAGDPASLVAPLREVVRGLDANQPIYDVRTMQELYTMRAVTTFKVLLQTVSAMGLMGLGLAIVGLYGLVAYAASRRTKEIGIRMAIGANRTTVLRMMLRQGVSLAVAGLAVGLAAGVGVGGLLQAAFLSSGRRFDPVALFIVAAVVLAVTAAAVYIPARRASRLDPMRALRYE